MKMQVCILCGGTGTRLKEQTEFIPKPMVPIGGSPIIWHIMKHYSYYGCNDFILALGYKQEAFKEYFIHFERKHSDMIFDMRTGDIWYDDPLPPWRVTLSDTGENTLKGGRLKRIEKYINDDTFLMTYGDAVSNVNIKELVAFHKSHGKLVTMTGVHPEPRFGELIHKNGSVISYREKPNSENLVNGGFMVLGRDVFNYLDNQCDFEHGPLEKIAAEGQLMVYHHRGFWKCMDTLNDMIELQRIWDSGKAAWKIWQ